MESKEVSAMLFSCNKDEMVVSGLSAEEGLAAGNLLEVLISNRKVRWCREER